MAVLSLPALAQFHAATTTNSGQGCHGLTLTASGAPVFGTTVSYPLYGAAPTTVISAMLLGLSAFPTGVELSSIGIPGCYQYLDLTAAAVNLMIGSPVPTYQIAVPSLPSLAGLALGLQGVALDSAYAGNAATSDAVTTVVGFDAANVPAASQHMGQNSLGTPRHQEHQVTLTYPFWLGKYEVTQTEWVARMGSNPSWYQLGSWQRPVETVSWSDARSYCQALTQFEQAAGRVPAGYEYRLPTEAEWEYCCRAGTTTEWNTGTSLSTSQANISSSQTVTFGSYAANPWGLHDTHGNVWEWCLDSYANYSASAVTDPFVTGGNSRVIRGGSWLNPAVYCRSANRYYGTPGNGYYDVGFRVALAPIRVLEPVASFTATPTSGQVPLVVQFNDTSTNVPLSWQWDFQNDGVVDSTLQSPSFTYTAQGTYSVRLVVGNAGGTNQVVMSDLITSNPIGPNVISIAPGTFTMGQNSVNFATEHQVTLSYPFWIGKYEVTHTEWVARMGYNLSYWQGGQRPVEQVAWNTARSYCQALTQFEQAAGRVPSGYEYRLPTEAEWEYCCRAGTTTEWNTGTSLSTSQANFNYSVNQTTTVGSYAANPWGLHDTHGNVSEWCLDCPDSYPASPVIDPFVTGSTGDQRVYRGGHVYSGEYGCRSASRSWFYPSIPLSDLGFRVALAPILVP